MKQISVLTAVGPDLLRRGVVDLLAGHDDLLSCGSSGSAAEAAEMAAALRPDVAVISMVLPDDSGVGLCHRLQSVSPATRSVLLTPRYDDDELTAAVVAGAVGYLVDTARGGELLDAVRTGATGRVALTADATRRVLHRLQHPDVVEDPLRELTEQERRILLLIGDGLSNREIGTRMGLTEKTIKNHVSILLHKLRMQRRTQAAVLAERLRSTTLSA